MELNKVRTKKQYFELGMDRLINTVLIMSKSQNNNVEELSKSLQTFKALTMKDFEFIKRLEE